jgi:hypothetical protein
MGINLELNFCDDGIYLNYWDLVHGNDVIGKVNYKAAGWLEVDGVYISYRDFFNRVRQIAEKGCDEK